jgi:hypothetical protein
MALKSALLVVTAALAFAPLAAAQEPVNTPLKFDADSISRDKPFGDIDVSVAMGANKDVGAWAGTLTVQQRAELVARCAFITITPDFAADAVDFCKTFGDWDKANPVKQ